jgi:DNA-binding LacI/PurR family transcriptional regulator
MEAMLTIAPEPRIDVIEQPIEAMAQASIDILLDLVEGRTESNEPVRRVFPARLLVRGSSGPPRQD